MYPSLNPFIVRQQRATEVFRLIRLIKDSNKYSNETVESDGARHIRRNVTGKRGTGGWI